MSEKVFVTVVFVIAYIVPLLIIALVYCLAGLRLCRRKLPGHQNPPAHKKVQTSSRRATAMLITVTVILALPWLPLQALEMIKVHNPSLSVEIPIEVHVIDPWFGYCNSAINPVLYVIFSENYRREFYRILCRGQVRKTPGGRLLKIDLPRVKKDIESRKKQVILSAKLISSQL